MLHLDLSIGWGGAILLVLLGLLVFLILYLRGTFRNKIKYRMKEFPGLEDPNFAFIAGLSTSLPTQARIADFWAEPEAIYAARLEAIRGAQETIHFETFFMTPGRRANEFAAALAAQAQAGVKIRFIADHFGILTLPKKYWQRLRAAGVEVRFFHRFDWKAPLAYLARTHRKLLIVDGKAALVGGMGVSDYWDGMKKIGDVAPWLDCEVRIEGPVVTTLEGIFLQHWIYMGGSSFLKPAPETQPSQGSTVLVTPSDSSYRVSPINTLFYASILAADKRVWIASPYFVLDSNLRSALITTKKRGGDVRVLTVGPHNDKKFVYYAARELYGSLLRAGIEVYEYQPSMMHAKVVLINDHWVSTGSANFDPRSFFQNDELHLSVSEPQLAKKVEHFFVSGFADGQRVAFQDWQARPWRGRLVGRLALFLGWQL